MRPLMTEKWITRKGAITQRGSPRSDSGTVQMRLDANGRIERKSERAQQKTPRDWWLDDNKKAEFQLSQSDSTKPRHLKTQSRFYFCSRKRTSAIPSLIYHNCKSCFHPVIIAVCVTLVMTGRHFPERYMEPNSCNLRPAQSQIETIGRFKYFIVLGKSNSLMML